MSRPLDARSGQSFSFGPFLFAPDRQLLLENDKPIRIGSRALELLAVLLERPGELFTKDELISRVWPDTEVEESNLKVNVAALRKVFGEGRAGNRFIATTSGRGYRFVFPVRVLPAGMPVGSGRASGKNGHVVARVIGRADAADSLKGLLSRKRLVTIVGPGGIGKTTVARMMVEASPVKMSDGVWLVDLAPTSEGRFVPNAVAASLGLFTTTDDVLAAVVAYLRDKQSLIILDNCEHLISDAANCAERIVHNAPNVGILATSREPLRVRGEQIFHLMPLECPPAGTAPEASEAKRFSAVELFEERASAVSDYKLIDTDTADVCDICRKLDGIPLAIELVASRADAFSVRELSTILFSQVQVLNRGRRGPKRHQDLNAMVDWSYRLLSANEQVLLRRLGVFAGQFSLEAACTIAADSENTTPSLVEGIASLVTKSLVSTDTTGERVRYRLLETTRLYACRKLEQSDESSATARRHAEYYRDILMNAEDAWQRTPTTEWLESNCLSLADLRNALDWGFSSSGDASIAVALTVAAVPLYFQLALLDECRENVERAIAAISPRRGTSDENWMKLHTALASSLLYARGPSDRVGVALTKALGIAERIGDTEYRIRALHGLTLYNIYVADHRQALVFARRFKKLATKSDDPSTRFSGERLMSVPLHYLGDQAASRRHIERALSQYAAPLRRSHITRFQLETQQAGLTTLTIVLWLQGLPDQAIQTAKNAVEVARSTGHSLSISNALAHAAFPVALWAGDLTLAERHLAALKDHLDHHPMALWSGLASCLEGMLMIEQSDPLGVRELSAGIKRLEEEKFGLRRVIYLGCLALGLASSHKMAEARKVLRAARNWAERREPWYVGALMCIEGQMAELEMKGDWFIVAERCYREALVWSRKIKIRSVQLTAAIRLASLQRQRGLFRESRGPLADVYSKYTEGFNTRDLLVARKLLAEFDAKLVE